MFSEKKDNKSTDEPTSGQNRINQGTVIKGDIESKGFFRIDGSIEGNINTPSKVVLGKSGKVNGTLICENADIEGAFDGKLDVSDTLTLRSSAVITGEIVVGKLAVEPGASLNATCAMKGSIKASTEKGSSKDKDKAHPFDRSQRVKKSSETLN